MTFGTFRSSLPMFRHLLSRLRLQHKRGATATCDKAGAPNDVCPYVQVMSASPNDEAFGNDVVPTAQWANITSLRPTGATSLRTK